MATEPSRLPGIDKLVNASALRPLVAHHGPESVKLALRALQNELRASGDIPAWATSPEGYAKPLEAALAGKGYQPYTT